MRRPVDWRNQLVEVEAVVSLDHATTELNEYISKTRCTGPSGPIHLAPVEGWWPSATCTERLRAHSAVKICAVKMCAVKMCAVKMCAVEMCPVKMCAVKKFAGEFCGWTEHGQSTNGGQLVF
jgi:hypothetical protein